MSPIERIFEYKKAFVGFAMGGDGGVDYCVESCLSLVEGGVDILEIGLPFSDPLADGSVIQKAAGRALSQGTTSGTLLDIARRLKQHTQTPLVLFSYYNPVLQAGAGYFEEAKAAGFDGVLIVDVPLYLPKGEDKFYLQASAKAGLDPILIVTPSTRADRLALIASQSQGFLYYAIQKGTTGVRNALPQDFESQLKRIRQTTQRPVVAGFGIANRESARQALAHADGFVVGSAFVRLMEDRCDPQALTKLAQEIDPR